MDTLDTLKNKKFSEIETISNSTKVKVWVDIINRTIQENKSREYIFNALSVKGQAIYDFSTAVGIPDRFQFFDDDNYIVTYGGIVLQSDDYKLYSTAIEFINGAPLEDDYLITIRYMGKKNDIRI